MSIIKCFMLPLCTNSIVHLHEHPWISSLANCSNLHAFELFGRNSSPPGDTSRYWDTYTSHTAVTIDKTQFGFMLGPRAPASTSNCNSWKSLWHATTTGGPCPSVLRLHDCQFVPPTSTGLGKPSRIAEGKRFVLIKFILDHVIVLNTRDNNTKCKNLKLDE